ncbi:MAG: hypothetical protein HUU16_16325, partial [Candidatus Omnitrophica bacterium]|nr:hypothetical protein [Candidatus Omnitrophota bacterium]
MKPGQTDTFQPDPDMDRLLREVGDAWAEDSCRSSERFMASFDSTLRRLGPAPRRETVRPGWTWRRWLLPALAVAACVLGIPVFLYQQSSVTGTILFQEGDLVVQGSGRNSRELAKGSLISSGEDGQGYLSLDRDRINLFVQR